MLAEDPLSAIVDVFDDDEDSVIHVVLIGRAQNVKTLFRHKNNLIIIHVDPQSSSIIPILTMIRHQLQGLTLDAIVYDADDISSAAIFASLQNRFVVGALSRTTSTLAQIAITSVKQTSQQIQLIEQGILQWIIYRDISISTASIWDSVIQTIYRQRRDVSNVRASVGRKTDVLSDFVDQSIFTIVSLSESIRTKAMGRINFLVTKDYILKSLTGILALLQHLKIWLESSRERSSVPASQNQEEFNNRVRVLKSNLITAISGLLPVADYPLSNISSVKKLSQQDCGGDSSSRKGECSVDLMSLYPSDNEVDDYEIQCLTGSSSVTISVQTPLTWLQIESQLNSPTTPDCEDSIGRKRQLRGLNRHDNEHLDDAFQRFRAKVGGSRDPVCESPTHRVHPFSNSEDILKTPENIKMDRFSKFRGQIRTELCSPLQFSPSPSSPMTPLPDHRPQRLSRMASDTILDNDHIALERPMLSPPKNVIRVSTPRKRLTQSFTSLSPLVLDDNYWAQRSSESKSFRSERIMKRQVQRIKTSLVSPTLPRNTGMFTHFSRHKQACRRQRGDDGRFLTKEELAILRFQGHIGNNIEEEFSEGNDGSFDSSGKYSWEGMDGDWSSSGATLPSSTAQSELMTILHMDDRLDEWVDAFALSSTMSSEFSPQSKMSFSNDFESLLPGNHYDFSLSNILSLRSSDNSESNMESTCSDDCRNFNFDLPFDFDESVDVM